MKFFALPLLLLFSSMSVASGIDWYKLKLDNYSIFTTKDKLIKKYGAGKRNKPDYECGAFTDEQPGAPYHQIVYPSFTFIGGTKGNFLLQEYVFSDNAIGTLTYKDKKLSNATTIDEFIQIFDLRLKDINTEHVFLHSFTSDDAASFTFKNNKLSKLRYWTDC